MVLCEKCGKIVATYDARLMPTTRGLVVVCKWCVKELEKHDGH